VKYSWYHRLSIFCAHLFLIIVSIGFIFPFLWMVFSSFKDSSQLFSNVLNLLPSRITFENYLYALKEVPLLRSLLNSVVVAVGFTVLSLFVGSLAGFAFAKYSFKGKKILFAILIVNMMLPSTVKLVPNFIIAAHLGWIDTFLPIIIMGAIDSFGIYYIKEYISSAVHNDILNSARIDGCGEFSIYWNIILPIIRPALITIGIMNFFGAWNGFVWPLIVLRSPEKYTAILAVNCLKTSRFNTPWGAVMAGSTLIVIPLVILFIFLQKKIISGITEGAIK